MSKIGVEISTTIRSGPINEGPVSGRFQMAAITTTGPVDRALIVRSIADYEALYGPRTSYSATGYDTARLFFEEGGSELIVSRVVGPAATADTLTLVDGSAAETLQITALSPGSYNGALTVSVNQVDDTVSVTVRLDGTVMEILTGATPAELVTASSKSPLVDITDLGSPTAAPGNLPATIAATSLTGGSDDRASVTAEHVISALELAGELGEGGSVAAPGYPASVIGLQLIAYASANKRAAILAPEVTATAETVLVEAADYISGAGDSAGLFFPHVVIPDGSGTRTISPEGYIAAMRARAHDQVGYWRKPFGDIAQMQWAIGTNVPVNTALNNRLNDAKVNGIVTTGTKTRLYGWASLSANPDMAAISDRDVLNNLGRELKNLLEPYVGEPIDGLGHLMGRVEGEVEGHVATIADAGGLFALVRDGDEIDPGYQVSVNQSNNPLSSLAANILNVTVMIRLSPTADWIRVEIIKVPLQGAF